MLEKRITSKSPIHIGLVLDDSGSMEGHPADCVNEAVRSMIEECRNKSHGKKPYFKISIVKYGSKPTRIAENETEVELLSRINDITKFAGRSGITNVAPALDEMSEMLLSNPGKAEDCMAQIFFLTDGKADDGQAALAAAQRLKNLNLPAGNPILICIGIGKEPNKALLKQMASNAECYVHFDSPEELCNYLPVYGTIKMSSSETPIYTTVKEVELIPQSYQQ